MGVLWLSREDVRQAIGVDPRTAVPWIKSALSTHAEGDTCQPLKPYLTIPGDTQSRRIIAMPAYLGGHFQTWGLKWIASAPENPIARGLERASAIIILNDLVTGHPLVMMEGAFVSAVRTAAVALVAAEYLAPADPVTLASIGNGLIGSLITSSLLQAYPSLKIVQLYDQAPAQSDALKTRLLERGQTEIRLADGPAEALKGAQLVVTATTAQDGYIEAAWLVPGSLFLNISLRDPKFSVVEWADKLVVDDWEQINRSNTIIHRMTQNGLLARTDLYAELADIIAGRVPGRESDEESIMFNPMGLAIEDIATAWGVYGKAKEKGLGTFLESDQ